MSEIMTLEEAVRQRIIKVGKKKEDTSGILGHYLDYRPVAGKCILTPEQTGCGEKQIFKTEELDWKLEKIGKKFLLVTDDATDAELELCGKQGYNNGIEAMVLMCRALYSNPLLGCKATTITKEIDRKVCGVISNKGYWFGSSFIDTGAGYAYFGMRRVDLGYVNYYYLYSSIGDTANGRYGVRPVVSLKSDLQVEISERCNGSKEKPWHIVIPEIRSTN